MIDSGFLIIDFNPNFMLFKKSTKFKGAGDLFWDENQLLRLKRLKSGVNKFVIMPIKGMFVYEVENYQIAQTQ